jgi:hypothetical protein
MMEAAQVFELTKRVCSPQKPIHAIELKKQRISE